MRMNTTFDTLSYTRRLEAAGVPAEQADAHALALSEALRTQLARVELNDKIEFFRFDLNARMDRMEAKQAAEFAELRALIRDEFNRLRIEIMRWIFGLWIGQTAVLFAALAYFRS